MFMDMMGVRVSSLVKSQLHKHTLLAGQVSVTFTDADGVEQVVRGGSQSVGSIPEGSRCTEASFTLLTAKPSGFEAVTYTVKRTDPRAELLITLTAEFMKHSGALPDDPFATYLRKSLKKKGDKAWSKRYVIARDINEELKRAASVIGLPIECISSKSLRESLATKNELAGVPIEETCEKGAGKKDRECRKRCTATPGPSG